MKRWGVITYEHGINELLNDLRLSALGNYEILGKCLNFTERKPSVQAPWEKMKFGSTSKNFPENSN